MFKLHGLIQWMLLIKYLRSDVLVATDKMCLNNVDGSPIWKTFAERSKVNLELKYLCMVFFSSV